MRKACIDIAFEFPNAWVKLPLLMNLLSRFLTCLIAIPAVHADVYHVATTGSDAQGDGSNEHPWAGIQKALDECAPGDTVLVHAGTYFQRVEWNVSGSAKAGVITLIGEDGTILSGKGVKGSQLIRVENQSHLRIENLQLVDNSNPKESGAIILEGSGSHITISKCRISRCKGKNAVAIGVYGTDAKTPYSDIVIDGNSITDCEPAPSEALVLNGNVTKFAVTNNTILRVNNIGIDFIGGEKDIVNDPAAVARDGLCKGNRVSYARSKYGGGYAAGIYVDGGRDIVIEENVVTGCDLGIEIGAENPKIITSGITVRSNIIYQNDKAGLALGGYDAERGRVLDCRIVSNQFYQNTQHKKAQAELWIQHASNNEIRENSFWVEKGKPMAQIYAAGKNNIVNGNTWFSEEGPEAVTYNWSGQNGRGFSNWQGASGWSSTGQFAKWTFVPPGEATVP